MHSLFRGWHDERSEEIGNPSGSMTQIPEHGRAVLSIDVASECGEDLVIHLFLAEMAKGLDHSAALTPGSSHVARGGMQEQDYAFADLHLPGRAVGEEYYARGHLFGEFQNICGVGTGRLESYGVTHHQGARDGIGGGGYNSKDCNKRN